MEPKKISVLVIDDSPAVRNALEEILLSDPAVGSVATAEDGLDALEKIRRHVPDVVTLDVEMPRMDGLTFLERIMRDQPLPVVMCSTLTAEGCETTLRALEFGALDVIQKPKVGTRQFFEEARIRICDAVRAASMARVAPVLVHRTSDPKYSADAVIAKPIRKPVVGRTQKVVVVGASTGGTRALRTVLEEMPVDAPGIVIVQHMSEGFTRVFAEDLDTHCRITVKEAADKDAVTRGVALIAPGNRHLLLKREGARYFVEVKDGPLVNRHRPSVDVLFRSAARYAGQNAVGVIMTGMGDDGARGMLELKQAGACTVAQDEASCVVFGMPKEAIKLGGVDTVAPLKGIAPVILQKLAVKDFEPEYR